MPDCYPELNETQRLIRDTARKVVERELKPHVARLEHGEEPPYRYIRNLAGALGMAGEGEFTAAMQEASPEDHLEFFVPAAVAIEISRVCAGVLVSYGVSYGQVAGPDASLLTQPSRAINQALDKAGKRVADVDLFEINEAFAAVGLASMDDLGVGSDVVNVNGGAIALGHPIGMSGARLALTLLHELKRRGAALGAAALCGGGGQGDALLVKSL